MRLPRSVQFDPSAPPWLHCISRCVRRAFLCGDGFEHRQNWIERRLQMLTTLFAVDCAAYAIMGNHLHVVIRPRPEQSEEWSPLQVAETWVRIKYARLENVDSVDGEEPLQGADHFGESALTQGQQAYAQTLSEDEAFVATWRARFGSASWFMKTLKEPIARAANKEDDCTGAFWEGRFRSTPLLDEAAILTCMAYVDLNPIRAGVTKELATSAHTSIAARVAHQQARDRVSSLIAQGASANAEHARTVLQQAGLNMAKGQRLNNNLSPKRDDQTTAPWLTPISGLLGERWRDFGPTDYLKLVDNAGRIIRGDKRGAIPADSAAILDRLAVDHDDWIATLGRPRSLLGAVLGHMAAREQEIRRRCCKWLQVRCRLFAKEKAS